MLIIPLFHIYRHYDIKSPQHREKRAFEAITLAEEIISSLALREIAENLRSFADKLLCHPLFLYCIKEDKWEHWGRCKVEM